MIKNKSLYLKKKAQIKKISNNNQLLTNISVDNDQLSTNIYISDDNFVSLNNILTSSICIIVTGQLRTFFSKTYTSFVELINECKKKYKLIYIICVVSDEIDNKLIDLLQSLSIFYKIISYNDKKYNLELMQINNNIYNNYTYQNRKYKYENENNFANKNLVDVDAYMYHSGHFQFHQLKIGIDHATIIENEFNIKFDIFMRTRFDVKYPTNFVPTILDIQNENNESVIENILFYNNYIKQQCYSRIGNINNLVNYLKTAKIELPECTVRNNDLYISFGGVYLYNYKVVNNICTNSCTNILYAFNDSYFFGKSDIFKKLKNFVSEYGTIDSSLNINHYFAPEAQLCIFCDNYDINIIMYYDPSYTAVR